MKSKKKCTPMWGSCNLQSGHKGQHSQDTSPNITPSAKTMRSDLKRIEKLMDGLENVRSRWHKAEEIILVMRELLTSWQAITAAEYNTDERIQLNMLTKRMLND